MLTFFQYKLYLTAVAGLGALWWPLGCKQLLSLEWGRKPEHSEETLNTERLQPLNSGSNPGPSCCEATLTTLSPCCLSKSHPNTVTVITHIFCQRFSWFPLRSFSSFPPLLPLYLYPQVFPAEQCRPELNIWVIWLDRSEEVRMTLCPIKALLSQLIQRCRASPHLHNTFWRTHDCQRAPHVVVLTLTKIILFFIFGR